MLEQCFNAWEMGRSGMEKRITASVAGTSVFTLLGHNYKLMKVELGSCAELGQGLYNRAG